MWPGACFGVAKCAKNDFYRWTFAVYSMVWNTNFESEESEVLSSSSKESYFHS